MGSGPRRRPGWSPPQRRGSRPVRMTTNVLPRPASLRARSAAVQLGQRPRDRQAEAGAGPAVSRRCPGDRIARRPGADRSRGCRGHRREPPGERHRLEHAAPAARSGRRSVRIYGVGEQVQRDLLQASTVAVDEARQAVVGGRQLLAAGRRRVGERSPSPPRQRRECPRARDEAPADRPPAASDRASR